jgi:hypothetical protein
MLSMGRDSFFSGGTGVLVVGVAGVGVFADFHIEDAPI